MVLIGHLGHEEVDGTMGEAPMVLASSVQDVENLNVSNPDKGVYLTQTTLSPDDTTQSRLPRKGSPLTPTPPDNKDAPVYKPVAWRQDAAV